LHSEHGVDGNSLLNFVVSAELHNEHGVDGNSLLNFVVLAELLPWPELSRFSKLWPNFFFAQAA